MPLHPFHTVLFDFFRFNSLSLQKIKTWRASQLETAKKRYDYSPIADIPSLAGIPPREATRAVDGLHGSP